MSATFALSPINPREENRKSEKETVQDFIQTNSIIADSKSSSMNLQGLGIVLLTDTLLITTLIISSSFRPISRLIARCWTIFSLKKHYWNSSHAKWFVVNVASILRHRFTVYWRRCLASRVIKPSDILIISISSITRLFMNYNSSTYINNNSTPCGSEPT